jgi:hypothetical protein
MVNILDVWPSEKMSSPRPGSSYTWWELFVARREIYQGFAELEKDYGFLQPVTSYATSKGQEMVRMIILRGLEELQEALEAEDPAHVKEEIIDALNYFWVLGILDPFLDLRGLCDEFATRFDLIDESPPAGGLDGTKGDSRTLNGDAIAFAMRAASPLLESLRNRPWQQHSQSLYFDGFPALCAFLLDITDYLLQFFESWGEFWRYYYAKSEVLRFRLRSNY